MKTQRSFRYFIIVSLILLLIPLSYEISQDLLNARAAYPTVQTTIFLDTTAPTFTLPTVEAGGNVAYSVTNFSGATVMQGHAAVTGQQTGLTLPRLPDDYYVLQITSQISGSPVTQTIPFAVVAPFTPPANSPFGVGVHFTNGYNPGLAQSIVNMGSGTIRDDATWAMIERTQGNYTFNNFDPYMQVLQQNTLAPLLVLDYNNRFYDNNQTPYDSAGFNAFANYAKALVQHYGPQLKAVEVYNEYNGTFSTGPCARNAACYAQLLRYTYQAVKSVQPDVTVVGGATLYADLPWFEDLFEDGGLSYMDAVSVHPYAPFYFFSPEAQGLEGQMQSLQALIKRYNHGQAKPTWITEIGWPSSYMDMNESRQADYLVRGMVLSLAAGVQKIFWYDFLNDGNTTSQMEQNFGLLRQPDTAGYYTPKPAYVAYAVLARELASRTFIGSETIAPGIYDMRFSNNLRILWSTPFGQNVALSTNSPVAEISMTGRSQTLTPSGGRIVLNLSTNPVYIEGNVSGVGWTW